MGCYHRKNVLVMPFCAAMSTQEIINGKEALRSFIQQLGESRIAYSDFKVSHFTKFQSQICLIDTCRVKLEAKADQVAAMVTEFNQFIDNFSANEKHNFYM